MRGRYRRDVGSQAGGAATVRCGRPSPAGREGPADPRGDRITDDLDFTADEAAAVYRAIALRRDMRHFRPDPVPPDVLERLLEAAHRAPSVGFMQPWRFVRVTDPDLRRAV
ncbi:MAG TPA: nitroreductase family protein, partial [Acidimicrobiales bacterium]|nr:nitroreductase family protein [Acidimicrobiales bacterium]